MNPKLVRSIAASQLCAVALLAFGCDSLSREDELRAQVDVCQAFLKDLEEAKTPAQAKKTLEDHTPKLEKAKKSSAKATGWLSVSQEVRDDWKECYDSSRALLDKHDGKLAIEFGELHGGS